MCEPNSILMSGFSFIITTILSMILDNVTTVILLAPVTIIIARMLKISPIPLLIAEAILSNTGGVATLVGDPPNIMIGSAAGFSFNDFLSQEVNARGWAKKTIQGNGGKDGKKYDGKPASYSAFQKHCESKGWNEAGQEARQYLATLQAENPKFDLDN